MTHRTPGRLRLAMRGSVPLMCTFAIACRDARPYRFGVVLDRVGMEGATLAAARINAQGGIGGHRLELRDVGSAATTARPSLETAVRLAADPTVLAVIGHTNSSSSLSASQVYNARQVVQLAPTSTSPLYSRAGRYSFRLVASDVRQGAFLAAQVFGGARRLRTAVLYVNNDCGRPLNGVLVERLRGSGMTPVYDAPFSEGDVVDGAQIAASLTHERPDLLIWLGRADDFAPVAQTVLSYDAVALPAQAIREVGPHREAIRDRLARAAPGTPVFTGLSSPIVFSSGGDRVPQYFLIRHGKMTVSPR